MLGLFPGGVDESREAGRVDGSLARCVSYGRASYAVVYTN